MLLYTCPLKEYWPQLVLKLGCNMKRDTKRDAQYVNVKRKYLAAIGQEKNTPRKQKHNVSSKSASRFCFSNACHQSITMMMLLMMPLKRRHLRAHLRSSETHLCARPSAAFQRTFCFSVLLKRFRWNSTYWKRRIIDALPIAYSPAPSFFVPQHLPHKPAFLLSFLRPPCSRVVHF